jgi:multidrug efflux pump subunit AcrB
LSHVQYLLTVKDGRIGKSRQIRPFKVGYEGRHGNLDELAAAAERALARFAQTKHVDVIIDLLPDRTEIHADVYCDKSNTPIGRVKFEKIEEEK